jgi:hypothetical protein
MILRGMSSAPCLAWDGDFSFVRVSELAQLENTTTTPMVNVPSGMTLAVFLEQIARTSGTFASVAGALGILVTDLALTLPNDFAVGTGSSGLAFIHDGSLFFPSFTGFGAPANIAMGQDGGYGPTSFRPAGLFQPVKPGCAYFDTTLGKMIWWNGNTSQWVDASGAPV